VELAGVRASAYKLNEDKTPCKDVATYNNFYEFGTGKGDPAENAGSLKTRPRTVAAEGEVRNSTTYGIDTLLKIAPLDERAYRMRCV
jgi:sulfoxide reductase catalytic subunit YedY